MGLSKKFYEHGAHFEYRALYLILEKISKKIKIRINSSLPKKKNISLIKKRASSCKKKSSKKNNIKLDLSSIYMNKNRYIDNKKMFNNSLIIKERDIKKLSFGKNKNNSFNNKIKNKKNSLNKKYYKYNTSIINKSMENFYSENKFNLYESLNLNSNHKEKENGFNNKIMNITCKKNLKFNAFVLSDFGKKNDNIIFSYNEKIKKDNSEFFNKYKYENEYFTVKNKNLITKDNKNKSITIIDTVNMSQQILNKKKYKLDISDPNSFKPKDNNCQNKKIINDYLNSSFHIKSAKNNYPKKIDKGRGFFINYPKKIVVKQKLNTDKASFNDCLKLKKSSKNQGKQKIKLSRNKENLKTAKSLFGANKKCQLSMNNYKFNSLMKNETQKINHYKNYLDLKKEKEADVNKITKSK